MRIGRWLLGEKKSPDEPVIDIGEDERQENKDRNPEREVRRDIEARLRAIEVEYGLKVKPIKAKRVGG